MSQLLLILQFVTNETSPTTQIHSFSASLAKKKFHQGQTSKRCVSKVEERLNSFGIYQPTITNFCDNILGIIFRCSHLLYPTTRGKLNEEYIQILNVSMGPVKPHFKVFIKLK